MPRVVEPRGRGVLPQYRYTRLRWRLICAVLDIVGGLVCWLPRLLRRATGTEATVDRVRRILVVQLDHLGDAVLSTVLFPALARRFPGAQIDVLASRSNAEVFASLPDVRRVMVAANRFDRDRALPLAWIAAIFYWGLRLRRDRYEVAIDVRGELPHAVLLWLSGARVRLGWASGGGGFLLTHSPRFEAARAEGASRLALLGQLGIAAADVPAFSRIVPPPAAMDAVADRLADREAIHPRHGPRIVLHLGAGTPAKRWPLAYWAELAGRLVEQLAAEVVLVGSEPARIAAVPEVIDWSGQLSFAELAAVLAQADLAIGCDSGPAHVAAAVGTPSVVLFSGTNRAEQWRPNAPRLAVVQNRVACAPCRQTVCPHPDHPCMRGLSPEAVLTAARRLLLDADGDSAEEAARADLPPMEALIELGSPR